MVLWWWFQVYVPPRMMHRPEEAHTGLVHESAEMTGSDFAF